MTLRLSDELTKGNIDKIELVWLINIYKYESLWQKARKGLRSGVSVGNKFKVPSGMFMLNLASKTGPQLINRNYTS